MKKSCKLEDMKVLRDIRIVTFAKCEKKEKIENEQEQCLVDVILMSALEHLLAKYAEECTT